MASDLYTYQDRSGRNHTIRIDGTEVHPPRDRLGYSDSRLERADADRRMLEVGVVSTDEIRRARWSVLDAVVDESARSTIHADYLLEGSWPTLVEIDRPRG